MMGIIIWLIVGGIIGWIASMIMKTDGQQGIFLNIVVGIIGAFLGGWIGGMLGIGGDINSGDFSLSGLLMSLVGAIILLAIVNLFRRGRVRCTRFGRKKGPAFAGPFFCARRVSPPWRWHRRRRAFPPSATACRRP